jgi:hypothetical protein
MASFSRFTKTFVFERDSSSNPSVNARRVWPINRAKAGSLEFLPESSNSSLNLPRTTTYFFEILSATGEEATLSQYDCASVGCRAVGGDETVVVCGVEFTAVFVLLVSDD